MYVDTNGTLFNLGYVINAVGSFNRYTGADGITYCDVGQVLLSEDKLYQFSIRTCVDAPNNYQFKHAYFYSGYCAIWYVTNTIQSDATKIYIKYQYVEAGTYYILFSNGAFINAIPIVPNAGIESHLICYTDIIEDTSNYIIYYYFMNNKNSNVYKITSRSCISIYYMNTALYPLPKT